MDNLDSAVITNIKNIFNINLNLRKDERCLVLSDLPSENEILNKPQSHLLNMLNRTLLARDFYVVCKTFFTKQVDFKTFIGAGIHGAEPPDEISKLMLKYDVIIMLTTYSLTHTNARINASKNGARIASLPGFTREMLLPGGPMDINYYKISEESKKIAEIGSEIDTVRIEFPSGECFTLRKGKRVFYVDDGIYTSNGSFGNLPAGEVYCAPLEGSAQGVLPVQQGWFPNLTEDMFIKVNNGFVEEIEGGGNVGEELRELLNLKVGKTLTDPHRNIAELGIGTNPNAKNPQIPLEAEKIKGTIHIAIGDNHNFGGEVLTDLHIDFVFPDATVWFDDLLVIESGRHLFDSIS
ncbi:MAG: aminopeptidase [Candidatus Odinarchaeia archaeon]